MAVVGGGAISIAPVGDICVDRYLPPVGVSTIGGNAVNVAVQLRQRGHAVAFLGAVGRDAVGGRILGALAAQEVDVGRVRFGAGATAWTDLRLEADGERTIAREEFGACADYAPTAADVAFLARLRHVHIGWLREADEQRRHLAGSGVTVSQNCAVTPGFADLDIALCSASDPFGDGSELAAAALGGGARLAVVTCGARDSLATDGRRFARVVAAPAHVADTTGAGDAFIAGFVDTWLAGPNLEACLAAGRGRRRRHAASSVAGRRSPFPTAPGPTGGDGQARHAVCGEASAGRSGTAIGRDGSPPCRMARVAGRVAGRLGG